MACPCNIVGLLSMNYRGIVSANLSGSTEVNIDDSGLVLLGQTLSTLSITAYPFLRGSNRYLGATCSASASASVTWIQKYDCSTDITYFIPKSGGKASITNGPINGVYLDCDPNIISKEFSASAQSGPATPYTTSSRKDGFNLVYTGSPIPIQSGVPQSYSINLGPFVVTAYLQSFNLSISPPSVATVSYNFVIGGVVL